MIPWGFVGTFCSDQGVGYSVSITWSQPCQTEYMLSLRVSPAPWCSASIGRSVERPKISLFTIDFMNSLRLPRMRASTYLAFCLVLLPNAVYPYPRFRRRLNSWESLWMRGHITRTQLSVSWRYIGLLVTGQPYDCPWGKIAPPTDYWISPSSEMFSLETLISTVLSTQI